jgi:putative PIN family toxin of toxin-antitoxin system
MIRVVLDTNVLISATLSPQGLPAQILLLIIFEPDIRLCMSAEIFAEYEEVLRRPRLNRSEHVVQSTLQTIRERSLWVKPSCSVHACSDPDDNIFLECAQAAQANYLVTGNARHYPVNWINTQIVTARQFLDALG